MSSYRGSLSLESKKHKSNENKISKAEICINGNRKPSFILTLKLFQ